MREKGIICLIQSLGEKRLQRFFQAGIFEDIRVQMPEHFRTPLRVRLSGPE